MWEMAQTVLLPSGDYQTVYLNRNPHRLGHASSYSTSASPDYLLSDYWEPCGVGANPGTGVMYIFKRKY